MNIINKIRNSKAISINDIKISKSAKNAIFLNPHSLRVAFENKEFSQAIKDCDYLFCDGIGLKLLCALCLVKVERRTGLSQTEAIILSLVRDVSNVALVGTTAGNLDKLSEKLRDMNPLIKIQNKIAPDFKLHFGDVDGAEIAHELNKTTPKLVLIGMTAPKQEVLSMHLKSHLEFPTTILCIGAVFDYLSDSTNKPPKWMRKFGLEWLFRLYIDPSKMWRRTFISIPLLIYYLVTRRTFD